MPDTFDIDYDARRAALIAKFKPTNQPAGSAPVQTGGVDHLALICSDMEQTIKFYTEVVGMTLNKVIPNRDEPSSTHIFLDMGSRKITADLKRKFQILLQHETLGIRQPRRLSQGD